jgi:hypothetical protein
MLLQHWILMCLMATTDLSHKNWLMLRMLLNPLSLILLLGKTLLVSMILGLIRPWGRNLRLNILLSPRWIVLLPQPVVYFGNTLIDYCASVADSWREFFIFCCAILLCNNGSIHSWLGWLKFPIAKFCVTNPNHKNKYSSGDQELSWMHTPPAKICENYKMHHNINIVWSEIRV